MFMRLSTVDRACYSTLCQSTGFVKTMLFKQDGLAPGLLMHSKIYFHDGEVTLLERKFVIASH
jgi:hypothetical protein